MKDPRYRIYFILAVIVLCLFSLSTKSAQKMRSAFISTLTPMWELAASAQTNTDGTSSSTSPTTTSKCTGDVDALKLENRRLRAEITSIKEMVRREMLLLEELKHSVLTPDIDEIIRITKKRYWQQFNLLMQLKAVPAKIIYRSPAFWDQYCWINVGTDTNNSLGASVVAKNSPVVVGDSIVGVIDEVGAKQARVRFLTDSSLTPSVRVLRKSEAGEDLYLAKGELHGASQPLWRGHGQVLKGVGFNYDFSDDEGPSRDLRTGRLSDDDSGVSETPLIKKGDLLVTTGMDGVFPPNFHIAEIIYVYPLGEGDYTYEIDAIPSAGDLDNLTQLFVLPPWRM